MSNIKKLIKNFASAASGNIIGQIIAFLASAYLARVLGPEGFGVFNFSISYSMYFFLISDLGLSLYCIREVNQSKNQDEVMNEIFSIKFYLAILSTILFYCSIFFMGNSYVEKQVLYVTGTSVFLTGILVDFMFTAKNNMKYVGIMAIIRNFVWYILCVLIVKNLNHLIYTSIFYSLGVGIAAIFLIFKFNKIYFKLRIKGINKSYFNTIKVALPLAMSLFMIQINNNFDIIYLGFKKSQIEVGYYSAAYKMINFLIAILTVYFSSSYAIIAELFKKNKKELSEYISRFYSIGIFLVTPITIGGLILSKEIMILLYGGGFSDSGILFALLVPVIYIRMVTSTFGSVLIMGDKSKKFSSGVIIGAIMNVILNIALIPHFGAKGSALVTIICESIQGLYLYYFYRIDCETNLINKSIKPLVGSIFMGSIIYTTNLSLFPSILLGVTTYLLIMLLINYKQIKNFKMIFKGSGF